MKAVIENVVLKTLLHSRKTARKAGTESTGNAQRSVSSPLQVAPTSFFFLPGKRDLNGLLADKGEGLLIMELGGLHARANPVSGDFSLIAKGFRLKNGKQGAPVEQVTVCREFLPTAERYPDSRKRSGISKAAESVLPTWMPEPFMLPENDVYFRLRLLNQMSCDIISCPEIRNF